MPAYILAFKPSIGLYGQHDPSAALFKDGKLVYGVEEERFTRTKHASYTFPQQAIQACLEYHDLAFSDLDRVLLPYDPQLQWKLLPHHVRDAVRVPGTLRKLAAIESKMTQLARAKYFPIRQVEARLAQIDTPVPPIDLKAHHECHAASAFYPSGFDEALVLTVDAKGEYDSTVVWRAKSNSFERLRTYEHPNSLGLFFAIITEYLGYRMFNGEGKVMGLAPYGEDDPEIESVLRALIDTGTDYDVTELTRRWGTDYGVRQLEEAFGRPRNDTPGEFDQWEKNLAYTVQTLLEETVLDIVETYVGRSGLQNVALAGGVALNCKMNKRVRESDAVDELFVQPVAHDAGLALGAGWLDQPPTAVSDMNTTYVGPDYKMAEIRDLLETNKIDYREPEDVERYVAERLADGALVGWFQGRMEMGPRALGNRSILADPRTIESRDRVNRYVKHREEWRPFAPSMLEDAADDYLENAVPSPFMIDTFDVKPEKSEEITAVVHPADDTTRPQTVSEDQNLQYYRLISMFAEITGVPVLLNTSFNDHAEPIVMTPTEALKDFYGMGLDVLALEDAVIEKPVPHEELASRGSSGIATQGGAESN